MQDETAGNPEGRAYKEPGTPPLEAFRYAWKNKKDRQRSLVPVF